MNNKVNPYEYILELENRVDTLLTQNKKLRMAIIRKDIQLSEQEDFINSMYSSEKENIALMLSAFINKN